MGSTLTLAHTGPGAGWQALVAMVGIGLAVVFALAAAGVLRIDSLDDLLVPIVAVAMISSFSLAAGPVVSVLSDWGGYAVLAGVVALVALVVSALSDLEVRGLTPLTASTVVVAVVAAILLGPVLHRAWHPPEPSAAAPMSADIHPAATIDEVRPAVGR